MNEHGSMVLEIIEDAVVCKCPLVDRTWQERGHESDWLTRPYAGVTHVVKGDSEIIWGDPQRRIFRTTGQTVYIPPNVWRKSRVLSSDGAEYLWIRVNFTVFSGIDVLSFFDVPLIFDVDAKEAFFDVLTRLSRAEGDQSSVFKVAVNRQRCLYELLSLIIERSTMKEDSFQAISRLNRLAPTLRFIEANFKNRLTVDRMADFANLSKSQFHRNFKAAFNISPLEYQKRLRLREAQRSLQLSDRSVAEIGEEIGYGDPFHFSRIFKDHFGLSPLKYRQSHGIDKMSL